MKIFLTNIPSFYKIKLYNELNKRIDLFVIFLSENNSYRNGEVRNLDFFNETIKFSYVFIKSKSLLGQCFEIMDIIKTKLPSEVLIGGWAYLQYWFVLFMSKKIKKSVVVESSIYDSETKGVQGFIKRFFLSRCSKAYVPGESNVALMRALNFKGDIIKTHGVGLYNRVQKIKVNNGQSVKNFIYVGRLAPEKNLEWLINQFNEMPQYNLNIVGYGPLESKLKKMANKNVFFIGAVDNKLLPEFYQKNDVFVLPSRSEPWGLVVEEALNCGIPVLLSDRVGCAAEIIIEGKNGYVFQLDNVEDFKNKLNMIEDKAIYSRMLEYISQIDFSSIEKKQIESYL